MAALANIDCPRFSAAGEPVVIGLDTTSSDPAQDLRTRRRALQGRLLELQDSHFFLTCLLNSKTPGAMPSSSSDPNLDHNHDHNILLDPLSELSLVLSQNAFGLSPDPSLTHIILEESYPTTPEEKAEIRSRKKGDGRGEKVRVRIRASASVGLLEGSVGVVVLDQRGYTVSQSHLTTDVGSLYHCDET